MGLAMITGLMVGAASTVPATASGASQLSLGWNYSCIKLPADTVKCWGRNNFGQLGNGTTTSGPTATYVKKSLGPTQYNATYSHIGAGTSTTCGVGSSASGYQTNGTLDCWGSNGNGELGNGTYSPTSRANPGQTLLTSGVTRVEGGYQFNCAIIAAGAVKCFGYGNAGQLGDGTTTFDNPNPVTVSGLTGASELSSGGYFMCALVSGGVKCWGQNTVGQLGNGAIAAAQPTPVDVLNNAGSSPLSGVTQVSGGSLHACALINDGTVKCWGGDVAGELGDGNSGSGAESRLPVNVVGISGATQISTGNNFTCALLSDKTVKCWGAGTLGQIGNGTTNPVNTTPATVTGLTGVTQIASGVQHSCALTETDQVFCWGSNFYGELGIPNSTASSSTPVVVPGVFPTPAQFQLTVTKSGSGSGTVTGSGINCGATCSANQLANSTVTLTATADSGSEFDGWSGDCSGVSTDCTVTMSQARSVNAIFSTVSNPEKLTVTKSGNGTGTVDGDGILCGSICEVFREKDSKATLIAKADSGSEFDGWSGDCSGVLTDCTVTMSQARTVNAIFKKLTTPEKLRVTKSGNGTGTVDGDGILCGSICEVFREKDSKATLVAKADEGSVFLAWSGACSGSSTKCDLKMDRSHTVNAEFAKRGSNEFVFRPPGGSSQETLISQVTVPGAGSVSQSATRRFGGKDVRACVGPVRLVKRAGTYRLSCKQTAATRAARTRGTVRVRVCVTYTPTGGTANRKCRNVILKALKKPSFTG